MTGYGAGEASGPLGHFAAEIRAVNNRFLDLAPRLPRELAALEPRVRALVKSRLSRGKVDLFVRWEADALAAPRVHFNTSLFCAYARQIKAMQAEAGDDSPLPMRYLLELPGVAVPASEAAAGEDALWEAVEPAISRAIENFHEERRREALAMAKDMQAQLAAIRAEMNRVESEREVILERYRERLRAKIDEWRETNSAAIDEGRLEAEVLFYADRCDVTEEIVRLRAHLDKFDATLRRPEGPAGKALEFLSQEMGREINTIGSKSRDTDQANAVLAMKGALEKIREQTANLE